MTALLQRLRAALAADYVVERELAVGGMGIVYVGRDIGLDRRVAIKVVRPELATAVGAERFLREARILASLSHPNIVPVHRTGEADGLLYYVMDFLEGETLADRLRRGPLSPQRAARLGDDLLAALEAVHARDVVHRDVKPSNIFLLEDRAVLGDFGVAKLTAAETTKYTLPGKLVGTPGYMAPEQVAGAPVGLAADIYAVGLVLYEALTGRDWPFVEPSARSDWTGVPRRLVPVLARALAWPANERWPSAGAFRRALAAAVRPRRWGRAALVTLAAGAAAALLWPPDRPPVGGRQVAILPFRVRGAAADAWLGDSIPIALARGLGANPDFAVRFARVAEARAGTPGLLLTGTVTRHGDSVEIEVLPDTGMRGTRSQYGRVAGSLAAWDALAADALAYQVLTWVWQDSGGPLASDLPMGALPRTRSGLIEWARAEQRFARGEWVAAEAAYREALAVDSTCLLCVVRLEDAARWMRQDHDSARVARYLRALDAFPPNYRELLAAAVSPVEVRWERLGRAAARYPRFHLAQFIYGDEVFHRGPLVGLPRREALALFRRATELRPDFAPAWEHLAEAAIAEGEVALAERALAEYQRRSDRGDMVVLELTTLNQVGMAWRFAPETAPQLTARVLADPMVRRMPDLDDATAYLMTFDVPQAVVWVGEQFARGVPTPGLEPRGEVARIVGLVALGLPDSALGVAAALASRSSEPEVALFAAELAALLPWLDSADVRAAWSALRGPLAAFADEEGGAPTLRRRAAWKLALLARRAGDRDAARRYRALLDAEPASRPFATLLDADSLARAGRAETALRHSGVLLALDSASTARVGDPFLRALVHLLRAQWHADVGQLARAVADLRWHENTDIVNYSPSLVQSAEIDFALGTLARWHRLRLLASLGRTGGEACRAIDDIARLWRNGAPPYAARARDAVSRRGALRCGGAA